MDSRLVSKMAALPKPLLLKDYLLDDIGSCSSNGFKSFPRRQYCCSSIRLIHDFDLKNKQHQKKYLIFNKPSSPKSSAFQRVIAAVKRLPFAAAKSPGKKISSNYSFLPRSLSKRVLKKSGFWKRKSSNDRKETERWKSFDQLLKEDAQPSDSWSGSDFTVTEEYCSSGNSSAEVNLNSPREKRNDAVETGAEVLITNKGVGATDGDVSLDSTTSSDDTNSSTSTKQKQWPTDEKEQFSPVSVLDCPFDDEDEVSSSSFQHRLARMEGAKKTLMKKIQRFECLAKLEPINLATRFVLQSDSDNESSSSFTTEDKFVSDIEEQEIEVENKAEYKALELLHRMPPYNHLIKLMHAEKLLLDFCRERIGNDQTVSSLEEELLEEAENWINDRKTRGVFLEWEVKENRVQAYVEDMGKCVGWKTLDQENDEVALELETQVFDALLNEVSLDFEDVVLLVV